MRKTILSLVTFAVLLLSVAAQAGATGLRLYAWQAHPGTPAFVLPVRADQTPRAAAIDYLTKLKSSPELMALFPNGVPEMDLEKFSNISEGSYESQALLIANRSGDYENESRRLKNFAQLYASAPEKFATKTFVLPIAANLSLNATETQDLYDQVAKTFSLLTPMGGHDADPELYGEENRHSLNVVPLRDKFEIGLIKTYVEKSKGFVFAICRGHQMTSVALGYKLVQDLPTEAPSEIGHAHGHHGVKLVNTAFGFLKNATRGQMSVEVNTLHHQAVLYQDGGPAVPAAYSPDGIVEGLEFKNGRGLTLQFHPELMDNALGRAIMHGVVRAKNRTIQRACRSLFS